MSIEDPVVVRAGDAREVELSSNLAASAALDAFMITQTLIRYSIALDSCAAELIKDCFTEDAVLVYDLGGVSRDELIAVSAGVRELDATQHFLSLPTITVDGDLAHSRCYFLAQHVKNVLAPDSTLMTGGWYDDAWRRTEQGWRIARRRAVRVWMEGNPAVERNQADGIETADGMRPNGAAKRTGSGRGPPYGFEGPAADRP